ncbi:MAG: sulfurtransferase [Rhodospirillales bacterium]|nr:sulfurtransferase [Rhodospirillales bacterium]
MDFVHPEYLVTTDWLAAHRGDPRVRIFDCTTHLIPDPRATYQVVPGHADFETGHIPGARFIDVQGDLSDPTHRFRFMRPTPDAFAAAMRRMGVNNGDRVILYSTANFWWASRVWWLLRCFGHENAAVLDGGFAKWRREGRAIATGPEPAPAPGDFQAGATRDLMADRTEVLAAIGDGGVCTINALTEAQHSGSGGNSYGRPGHIAGSTNIPAARLLDPETGTLLPPAALAAKFAEAGALDRKVIAYCGGGIAASADALVLTMLGHRDVKIYDASLSEWAIDPALPMETG